jgi:hypothetical protein
MRSVERSCDGKRVLSYQCQRSGPRDLAVLGDLEHVSQ